MSQNQPRKRTTRKAAEAETIIENEVGTLPDTVIEEVVVEEPVKEMPRLDDQPDAPQVSTKAAPKESDPTSSFAPRTFLMPYLLLMLRDLNMHGYELWEKLTKLGFPGFNENDRATVYRALRQLEKEGKVESRWDTASDGPARRVYALTPSGADFLAVWAQSLEQYRRTLDFFFTAYTGAPPTQPGTAKSPAEAAASIWTAALDANPWTNPSLNPLLAPYTEQGRAQRRSKPTNKTG